MKRGAFLFTFVGFAAVVIGWLAIHERDESLSPTPTASASEAGRPERPEPPPDVHDGAGGGMDIAAGGSTPDADGAGGADPLSFPELGDAPKSVRFGVVLVQYAGAQGAPEDARSKDDARTIADELATLAKDDFDEAVKKGDKGSVVDAGRMFRRILEPEVEYALFSLEEGEVSGVVDTPRGFWIVKRRD